MDSRNILWCDVVDVVYLIVIASSHTETMSRLCVCTVTMATIPQYILWEGIIM